jgi:hypothetical protein
MHGVCSTNIDGMDNVAAWKRMRTAASDAAANAEDVASCVDNDLEARGDR